MPARVHIQVRLHSILQQSGPDGRIDRLEVDLPEGSCLSDLLAMLEISLPEDALLLAANGHVVSSEYILQDGDALNLMPAMSGGI